MRASLLGVLGAGALGCGTSGRGGDGSLVDDPLADRELEDGSAFFPQSVASGDPKPESVILWTRAVDPADEGELRLLVQVALDPELTRLVALEGGGMLSASPRHDGCVRARIDGLSAGTTYYYRFAYLKGERTFVSRVGRTKTAPSPDADVTVRFAVASCQDYGGRYYHAYAHMAEQELDFVVHLGDYIYETGGDPLFQEADAERAVVFQDAKGAITLGSGDKTYLAARSLDNYRELYRTFRSDPALQRVHEQVPFVVIWDDHEFSDDCHGQTSTYFDGKEPELDPERRANADQAWFEYMPVDYTEPGFELTPGGTDFPDDLTIYRELRFGRHVHLVMTDERRYRDDHLVPEDAFPGAVAADQASLMEALGALPTLAAAYVDLDGPAYAEQRAALRAAATSLGFLESDFGGLVGVAFVNALLEELDGAAPPTIEEASKERGLIYADLFKRERYDDVGSRYVLVAEGLRALSRVRWQGSGGETEQMLGEAQERWFIDTLRASKHTWKVWGNELMLMPLTADLRDIEAAGALGLQHRILLSAEGWDGAPERREKLLEAVGDVANLVAVTGDVHAFFAGEVRSERDPKKRIVELVAGAISSAHFGSTLLAVTESISPLAAGLAKSAPELLPPANPHLAHIDIGSNGYGLVTADGDELSMTFYQLEGDAVLAPELATSLTAAFGARTFHVKAGHKELRRRKAGREERWDAERGAWEGV